MIRSTSCGAPGIALSCARFTRLSSSMRCACVGRRPAVSAISTSILRALAADYRVEHDGGRVASALGNHFHRCCAHPRSRVVRSAAATGSVAAASSTLFALVGKPLGELADGCRLGLLRYPGDHHDERMAPVEVEAAFGRRQQRCELVAQREPHFVLRLQAGELDPRLRDPMRRAEVVTATSAPISAISSSSRKFSSTTPPKTVRRC